MKKISFQSNLPVIFLKERGEFVAYTPALDLSTSGKTLTEARRRFVEAAGIVIEECYRNGTLAEFLRDLGWEKKKDTWMPPVIVAQGSRAVNIPIPA